jgi:hypothetical protein
MMKMLRDKLTPARDAVADLHDQLEAMRDEVAARAAAVAAIEAAPVPVEEAMQGFDEWVARTSTDALDRLNLHHLLAPGRAASGLDLPGGHAASEILLGLLLATGGDAMRTVIAAQLGDLARDRETIPAADRPALKAKAEAALLEAELSEEAVIRAIEGLGVAVRRRPDADPRAVLASDEALQ